MFAFVNYPSWLKPEIIPGFFVRWYSLMYIVAFTIAYVLLKKQVRESNKIKAADDDVSNFLTWGIIGLILGARIFFVFVYNTTYTNYLLKPWLIFWPFSPDGQFVGLSGLSYHGGVIGAVLGLVLYSRKTKIDLLEWGDLVVATIPLGYTFGRLGNFINAELYGRITASPIGMMFPNAEPVSIYEPGVREIVEKTNIALQPGDVYVNLPRHASQLYEALFEGIILWLVLWFFVKDRKPFKGFVIGAYIFGYGLVRFFIEYFRQPDEGIDFPLFNLTMGQILCLIMMVTGVSLWLIFGTMEKRRALKKG